MKFIRRYFYFILILITGLLAVFYFSLNINSWKFSFVGDEWAFYNFAKNIKLSDVDIFSLSGAYPDSPIMGSIPQAISMKLLGYNNFGWRFSNIILIIPISIFFFLSINNLLDKKIALISTILLQSSFYLANFFKVGKPIPLSLLLFVIILYLGILCEKKHHWKYYLLIGIFLGISFYIYIGPIFILIFFPYLIFFAFGNKKNGFKKSVINLGFIFIGYLLLLMPAIWQVYHNNFYLAEAAKKTIFKKEFVGYYPMLINVVHNFLLFYKNFDYSYNHFVSGPYLDIISGFFSLIGIAYLLFKIRIKPYLTILIVYISTAIVIGITSPYSYAPTTRGIFFIVFGVIFAAIGINLILNKISQKIFFPVVYLILFLIFCFNLYLSQIEVFKKTKPNQTSLIIKVLQEENNKHKPVNIILVLGADSSFNFNNINTIKEALILNNVQFKTVTNLDKNICHNSNNQIILLLKEDIDLAKKVKDLNCPLKIILL